ncbi:hypothetical protein TNCV_630941 [Trichonephila clavipes]|nr:hypothetical protein TNCV_630941 [Trichonephila clavipes]
MTFLEKAEKQDLILLAEDLGLRVSDKMTVIDLKNIIIGSKDYERFMLKGKQRKKIDRQHAIEQLRLENQNCINFG